MIPPVTVPGVDSQLLPACNHSENGYAWRVVGNANVRGMANARRYRDDSLSREVDYSDETGGGNPGLFGNRLGPELGRPAPAGRQAVALYCRFRRLRRRVWQDWLPDALNR